MKKLLSILLTAYCLLTTVVAQPVDKIIAVVGSNIIMMSDVEAQYLQILGQGYAEDPTIKCDLLEELLFQKLLVNQARLDSVEVSDEQVEEELNRRLRYFIGQIGSEEKLEEYYKKSIVEIKDDFRELIKDQLLAQNMQYKITGEVKVTPAEVRDYFSKIPSDSLPYINVELEIGRIVKKPIISKKEKDVAKARAEELRQRILDGAKFETMAKLYSEDPGSAANGGELGFFGRGNMVPEFEALAFSLNGKEISEVFETEYGFHFLQVIERRGEQVNARHILITPKTSENDLTGSKIFLDSIYDLLMKDSLTFTEAAEKFSDDEADKNNGGIVTNPQTGSTKFEMDQLSSIDPTLFLTIDKMKVGEFSKPIITSSQDGKQAYSIILLKSRTEPHKANLRDDYQKIQTAASTMKESNLVREWIEKKIATTYVRIDEAYLNCDFNNPWVKKSN
ncbi:MAG: Chaperone SurA [Bacteroidia bacterium]|nr:Chaperone SurA [Bacteroidia bacterium]